VADCDKALEVNPKFSRAAVRKARLLLRVGRTEEAKKACTIATVQDPREYVDRTITQLLCVCVSCG